MVLLLCACGPRPDATCHDDYMPIHEIQGSALSSKLIEQTVHTEGIVTALFEGNDQISSGLMIQSLEQEADQDEQTSESVYISTDQQANIGDRIRVSGVVAEIPADSGMTTVLAETLVYCGSVKTLPATISIQMPLPRHKAESLEGMRIEIDQAMQVTDVYALGTRAEIAIASSGPVWQPTELVPPGQQAMDIKVQNNQRMLIIDDFSFKYMPQMPAYLDLDLSPKTLPRVGDKLSGMIGILSQFGPLHLHLSDQLKIVSRKPHQRFSPATGNVTVGSFNLLNYFNGDGLGGGFPSSRGAATAEEFERQTQKLTAALSGLGHPDIVALMELENDGYNHTSAIAQLVNRLNRQINMGRTSYRYINASQSNLGGDQISVGIIYREDKVRPVGSAVTLTTPPFDYYNRPPLAQTFESVINSERFTMAVVHLKSKGCREADGHNMAQGDGQGCWNPKRLEASKALDSWLASDPTNSQDPDLLILGDFNAYRMEDPITYLEQSGYINLIEHFTDQPQYSFIYRGAAGSLDHAMASPSLLEQTNQVKIWHVNADYSAWLDYRLNSKPGRIDELLFRKSAFRSSDHDPLSIGLKLKPHLLQ